MNELSVSRTVHYIMSNGQHRPGVVVKVIDPTTCNLQVFTDASDAMNNVIFQGNVKQGDKVGDWHWPERTVTAPAPASHDAPPATASAV